jgi:hypothetical protein
VPNGTGGEYGSTIIFLDRASRPANEWW